MKICKDAFSLGEKYTLSSLSGKYWFWHSQYKLHSRDGFLVIPWLWYRMTWCSMNDCSWTIFSNTLMLPRGSVLENISHNLAKHEQTRFRKYQVIAAGTVLAHHSFKSSCRSEQHLSHWEIQNCCTRSIPIEWWQICISRVSLVEHLSMSDFPFPPRKIANVRDLVNVKSHSSYSVYIVDKAKASFAQRWKIYNTLVLLDSNVSPSGLLATR